MIVLMGIGWALAEEPAARTPVIQEAVEAPAVALGSIRSARVEHNAKGIAKMVFEVVVQQAYRGTSPGEVVTLRANGGPTRDGRGVMFDDQSRTNPRLVRAGAVGVFAWTPGEPAVSAVIWRALGKAADDCAVVQMSHVVLSTATWTTEIRFPEAGPGDLDVIDCSGSPAWADVARDVEERVAATQPRSSR